MTKTHISINAVVKAVRVDVNKQLDHLKRLENQFATSIESTWLQTHRFMHQPDMLVIHYAVCQNLQLVHPLVFDLLMRVHFISGIAWCQIWWFHHFRNSGCAGVAGLSVATGVLCINTFCRDPEPLCFCRFSIMDRADFPLISCFSIICNQWIQCCCRNFKHQEGGTHCTTTRFSGWRIDYKND